MFKEWDKPNKHPYEGDAAESFEEESADFFWGVADEENDNCFGESNDTN